MSKIILCTITSKISKLALSTESESMQSIKEQINTVFKTKRYISKLGLNLTKKKNVQVFPTENYILLKKKSLKFK